jgi:glucose-1-phosphatase
MLKNIIFDLGNVIIDIDFPRSEQELKRILTNDLEEKLRNINQNDLFLRYEVGNITETEFLATLKNISEHEVENQAIIDAWNAMLIGFKPARFEMLLRLAKKYNLFVLSNTNKTHIDWVHNDLKNNHNIVDYETNFFKKVYYSHEINLRKPNVEIYEYVLRDAKLIAEETLFIDDNFDNIEAAKTLNIQTIHHLLGNEIVDALRDF